MFDHKSQNIPLIWRGEGATYTFYIIKKTKIYKYRIVNIPIYQNIWQDHHQFSHWLPLPCHLKVEMMQQCEAEKLAYFLQDVEGNPVLEASTCHSVSQNMIIIN